MSTNVLLFGVTSLLADVAGEMIFPILPLFLGNELGMSKILIGLIEGFGESTSSLLKVFSGWISDRFRKRKIIIIIGYLTAALGKPLLALAHNPFLAFIARFFDRGGKGIRTAPRDALLAESISADKRGGVFGFHRMMDTLGGILGNGLTFLLIYFAFSYREIFWWATVPALLAVVALMGLKEPKPQSLPVLDIPEDHSKHLKSINVFQEIRKNYTRLGAWFWVFIGIAVLFSLANVGYAFLLLRAEVLGVPIFLLPLFYFVFNIFQAAFSWPFGRYSDRFGKKIFLFLGYSVFSVMSMGFIFSHSLWVVALLFALYGVFYAANEAVSRAFIIDLVPGDLKATAFGIYFMFTGFAALPAGLFAGYLWKYGDGSGTFWYSCLLSAVAAMLFLILFSKNMYGSKQV